MIDELEASVKRRSLVRVKMDFGTQEWRRDGVKNAEDEFVRDRWSIEEIEKWSVSLSPLSETLPWELTRL